MSSMPSEIFPEFMNFRNFSATAAAPNSVIRNKKLSRIGLSGKRSEVRNKFSTEQVQIKSAVEVP